MIIILKNQAFEIPDLHSITALLLYFSCFIIIQYGSECVTATFRPIS